MDHKEQIGRQNKFIRRNLSEFDEPEYYDQRLMNGHKRFSQPKSRINIIKINKSKFPVDFFPKADFSNKKIIMKISLKEQRFETVAFRKAESERKHISPQKTSFFGFFDEEDTLKRKIDNSKLYLRKFQTREESKRDPIKIENQRNLTPLTKSNKIQLLELFPPTLDQKTTQIIVSSSKNRQLKGSPRKDHLSKYRQNYNLMVDPEKLELFTSKKDENIASTKKKVFIESSIQMSNKSNCQTKLDIELLNITFCNSKSTCFPPINSGRGTKL